MQSVHPHVRGEYNNDSIDIPLSFGSSPRAWGIHLFGRAQHDGVRFIPTCVGNTIGRTAATRAASVHPHVRGEYNRVSALSSLENGSSPRAWGIRFKRIMRKKGRRFIPTCVGNTAGCSGKSFFTTVHPHVRGEYIFATAPRTHRSGSSPRAWGIPVTFSRKKQHGRFIPTCVGNTMRVA